VLGGSSKPCGRCSLARRRHHAGHGAAGRLAGLGTATPPGALQATGGHAEEDRDGILEHFRSGLSNGFAEAINGRTHAAPARAKDYGTDDHLITISYLICANLKRLPSNPWLDPAKQAAA